MNPANARGEEGARSGRLRFGRRHRLRRGRDFNRLFDEGVSRAGRLMVMRMVAGETECNRCGVIASKRVFRRAVDRNRAKRLLREAFRLEQERLPSQSRDMILIGRHGLLTSDIQAVRQEWRYLFERLDKRLDHSLHQPLAEITE